MIYVDQKNVLICHIICESWNVTGIHVLWLANIIGVPIQKALLSVYDLAAIPISSVHPTRCFRNLRMALWRDQAWRQRVKGLGKSKAEPQSCGKKKVRKNQSED